MHFPVRDVVPSRSRPLATWAALTLVSAAAVLHSPSSATVAMLLLHGVPLLVLAETVEDQLGHSRHGGLIALALAFGWYSGGALVALTAAVFGVHLSLFPTSRILVWYHVGILEVPSYFVAGCWFLLLVVLGEPLWPLLAAAPAVALARFIRRQACAQWAHFDTLA